MIADSNGDRSGDTRPLWITGLSPPDSWRSLRQPGYLQLDQARPPKHCVWGYDRTLKVRNLRSTKVGNFQSQLTGGTTSFVDVVEKHRKYFHPVGGGRGGWPVEPPNYLGFRYDGHLKSIHHVKSYRIVDDLAEYFPDQPSEKRDPRVLYELGPPICRAKPMRVGARLYAARRWCFIDTLLTSGTLAEALEATRKREQLIKVGAVAED